MIVLAVMALVVLIVVITIYFQENEKISGSLESCASKGGSCETDCKGGEIAYNIKCKEGVCCVRI